MPLDGVARMRGVSIVIPAWNDNARLTRTLQSYVPSLEEQNLPYEVIIVCDGDQTLPTELLPPTSHGMLRVLRFGSRLGKGGAVIAGLKRARYDRSGFVDSDGPIGPRDVVGLIRELDASDAAIAVRVSERRIGDHRPLSRRIMSMCWSASARALFLTRVKDTQFGAKFFRTEPLQEVLSAVAIRDWAFDLDLLYHWERRGLSLREVEVDWRDDSDSRLRAVRAVPAMIVALVGLRLYHSPARRLVAPGTARRMYYALGELTNGYATQSLHRGEPRTIGESVQSPASLFQLGEPDEIDAISLPANSRDSRVPGPEELVRERSGVDSAVEQA